MRYSIIFIKCNIAYSFFFLFFKFSLQIYIPISNFMNIIYFITYFSQINILSNYYSLNSDYNILNFQFINLRYINI